MIVALAGACRPDELCSMKVDDIEDRGSVIIIKIPESKINTQQRSFAIVDRYEKNIQCLEIFRKYAILRPKNTQYRRFFIRYQAGKCINQLVGKNTFSRIPSRIAEYLRLENPTSYTGHSLRRTSATLLANTGADVLNLIRHAEWKSSPVEGYVAEAMQNKVQV